METLVKDIRYGARMLLKKPGFTVVAVMTLALGIGANTAIFSVINAVLLRPLPYVEADRLVWLSERHQEIPTRWVSYPNFLDWQARSESFEAMATTRGWQMTITGGGEAQLLMARLVSADYFRVMRTSFVLGRPFHAEEDKFSSQGVVVLSHAFWQERFGGDPEIVGKAITLSNASLTVIGVTGPEFQHQGPPPVWVLIEQNAAPKSGWFGREIRMAGSVIARLKPGVTIEQARAEMHRVEEQLVSEYPMQNGGNAIRLVTLRDSIVGNTRQSLLLLFGAVAVVLLIACANVANLLLARAAGRQREIAIRAALGASRGRLLRQLLIESLLLAVAGGCLGLWIASWGVDLLVKFAPDDLPRMGGVAMGWQVLAFTFLLSLVTGVVFGLAPAWHSSRKDVHEMLKDGGRTAGDLRGGRLRNALVVIEVSLAMVLLAGGGLLVKSLARLVSSDPGFDARNVLTMELVPRDAYPKRPALVQFHSDLLARVGGVPGVEAASLLNELPGFEPGWQNDINPEINGQYQKINPGELINVDWSIVTADFFRTMGISIKQGRSFTPVEVATGAPVVIVDEQMARRFWPQGERENDALGKHLKYDSPTPIEIIGVAADVRNYDSELPGRIRMYTPMGRFPLGNVTLAVRSSGADPATLIDSIKAEIRATSPNVPISNVATLESLLARHIAPRRFNVSLLAFFAGVALLLAVIGIYGVMSYAVTQRTRELGIRIALGARKGDVFRLMLGASARLVASGLCLGLLASMALTRWLKSLLFGVSATDPSTLVAISLLLVLSALLASWIPARRAAKVDPMVALRYE